MHKPSEELQVNVGEEALELEEETLKPRRHEITVVVEVPELFEKPGRSNRLQWHWNG